MPTVSYNQLAAVLAICGAAIAMSGNDGWGWFLAVAWIVWAHQD